MAIDRRKIWAALAFILSMSISGPATAGLRELLSRWGQAQQASPVAKQRALPATATYHAVSRLPATENARPQIERIPAFTPPQAAVTQVAGEGDVDIEPSDPLSILRKQINNQQQQIATLEQMIQLSAGEIQRLQSATTPQTDFESDIAEIQARQRQAAVRDTELATHLDTIVERFDAHQRETALPSTAREHFLPMRFNESPIVHYGQFAFTYADFEDKDGNFASPVYFPRFLMMLNEQLILDVNPLIKSDEIQIIAAQVDWHVHDNLSLSFGRFYSPLGFFGERLQTGWVWKSVDIPLMFNQVYPTPFSVNGVMARGAYYPTQAPIKLEYAAMLGNGISLDIENGDLKEFADLNASRKLFNDVNNDKAVGGRLGISLPEQGLIVGMSGLANGAYDPDEEHDLYMWGVDVSLHRGNWDFRYEFIQVDQQSPFGPIDRTGQYIQAAYRNYDSLHPILQRLEYVFRLDTVDFDGIDLGVTGTAFGGREKIPVDRHRWLAQVNFYPYPSLNLKFGYEILDEQNFDEIDDNGFVAQILWGF